jgi:hypothetical protein
MIYAQKTGEFPLKQLAFFTSPIIDPTGSKNCSHSFDFIAFKLGPGGKSLDAGGRYALNVS